MDVLDPIAVRAAVEIVSVEVAAPPLTVTDAGEKEQVAAAGSPLQLNATL